MRCEGIGASGRLGRLLDRSGRELGVTFLDDSERLGMLVDVAAALDSFSRSICSLLSRTSDFRGSVTAEAPGVEGLGSAVVSAGVGMVVPVLAAVMEVFASSTSPSSTSAVVGAFGVDTPTELMIPLVLSYQYINSLTYLALDPGLNSGAVGFKVLFEGVPFA
jgi:hypothetical protein